MATTTTEEGLEGVRPTSASGNASTSIEDPRRAKARKLNIDPRSASQGSGMYKPPNRATKFTKSAQDRIDSLKSRIEVRKRHTHTHTERKEEGEEEEEEEKANENAVLSCLVFFFFPFKSWFSSFHLHSVATATFPRDFLSGGGGGGWKYIVILYVYMYTD